MLPQWSPTALTAVAVVRPPVRPAVMPDPARAVWIVSNNLEMTMLAGNWSKNSSCLANDQDWSPTATFSANKAACCNTPAAGASATCRPLNSK